jgi:2-polyprenyl-3-methyl-5-hydroxy-6-metoxy-1,4-benzoquinol methylase
MAADRSRLISRKARGAWARLTRASGPGSRYYADPARYWERRHQQFGDRLDGVGMKGLGEKGNREDYEAKWARLSAALADLDLAGARVLDAGCGIGWFTARLAAAGYDVAGVDFSPTAIEAARRRLGDGVPLAVGSLDAYRGGQPFAIVVCIDVLFHVVDDGLWQATVANLAANVAPDGVLIVQDHLVEAPEPVPDLAMQHTRWRSAAMYLDVLTGWDLIAHHHYMLPREGQTKDLLVLRRRPG